MVSIHTHLNAFIQYKIIEKIIEKIDIVIYILECVDIIIMKVCTVSGLLCLFFLNLK